MGHEISIPLIYMTSEYFDFMKKHMEALRSHLHFHHMQTGAPCSQEISRFEWMDFCFNTSNAPSPT